MQHKTQELLSKHSPSTFFLRHQLEGKFCRLRRRRRICSKVLNTSIEHIIIQAYTCVSLLAQLFDGGEHRACWRSLKLIIFRLTHFFSFIHLARLCIVYYFCRFSVVQGKSLRDLARAKEILPIKNSSAGNFA